MWINRCYLPGLFVLLLSLVGCGLLPQVFLNSLFVVNRDGHYYVGDRCGIIVEMGVFDNDGYQVESFEGAIWHVVSDPPLSREIELFGLDQPGVSIVYDSEERPEMMWLLISNGRGGWREAPISSVEIDELDNGEVYDPNQGIVSWEDYWAPSNNYEYCPLR